MRNFADETRAKTDNESVLDVSLKNSSELKQCQFVTLCRLTETPASESDSDINLRHVRFQHVNLLI